MDSLEKIVVTDDIQKIINELTICEGSKEELSPFITYIELTRHLKEIYQWYGIFNYNYDMIKPLYPDGNLYAINSHTISLISAGKNIVESIELCIKNSFSDGENQKKSFHTNYSSKEYNDNFSYRFLTRLRNFTQHLHIPVSKYTEFPCFDLSQIYETPHYAFNKKLLEETEQLISHVANKTGDNLTLSYRDTVCAYTCSIYKIFKAFMNIIHPAICEKMNNYKQLVQLQPEIITHENHPEFEGWIFYNVNEDKNLHAFNTNDDPTVEHIQLLNDSNERFKTETAALKELRREHIPI